MAAFRVRRESGTVSESTRGAANSELARSGSSQLGYEWNVYKGRASHREHRTQKKSTKGATRATVTMYETRRICLNPGQVTHERAPIHFSLVDEQYPTTGQVNRTPMSKLHEIKKLTYDLLLNIKPTTSMRRNY